jgi:hypothetical protein
VPAVAVAGPVSKFDEKAPKIDVLSTASLHDVERCLIDLDGHPAPQVYRQPDRPDEVRLLWIVQAKAVDRADLKATPQGTAVKIWTGSNQMRSCAESGRPRGTRGEVKPLPDTTLAIVGADYPNTRGPSRRFELAMCTPGEPVELRPEPKNPYDEHAVAVFSRRGVQLGYLASERAVRIGALIRDGVGVVAVFQAHTRAGGLIRVSFDGSTPDLPPEFPPDEEPEFYPDEEWPD